MKVSCSWIWQVNWAGSWLSFAQFSKIILADSHFSHVPTYCLFLLHLLLKLKLTTWHNAQKAAQSQRQNVLLIRLFTTLIFSQSPLGMGGKDHLWGSCPFKSAMFNSSLNRPRNSIMDSLRRKSSLLPNPVSSFIYSCLQSFTCNEFALVSVNFNFLRSIVSTGLLFVCHFVYGSELYFSFAPDW